MVLYVSSKNILQIGDFLCILIINIIKIIVYHNVLTFLKSFLLITILGLIHFNIMCPIVYTFYNIVTF